jgi:hypothetical protein
MLAVEEAMERYLKNTKLTELADQLRCPCDSKGQCQASIQL